MGSMIIKCEPCKGAGYIDADVDFKKILVKSSEPSKKTRKEKNNDKKESAGQGSEGQRKEA